ncbi:MAG: hypothetical protein M8467_14905 [Anaerolineae bacterium]|nr:hypothetical protein [Anaerolineae bacterium]
MIDALRMVRYSLRDFWDEFVPLVMMNLVWSVTAALPFLVLLGLGGLDPLLRLGLSLLLMLPAFVVTGGLCFAANQVARGKTTNLGMFGEGLRRYWAKSLVVGSINVVALFLLATNLQFYAFVLEGGWTNLALSLWLVAGIYWGLVQIFWFPMILELENEKVLLALRNAIVMVIISPGFSISLGLLLLVLTVLCVLLTVPAVLVMASLLLLVANHATRSRLALAQKRPYRPGLDGD